MNYLPYNMCFGGFPEENCEAVCIDYDGFADCCDSHQFGEMGSVKDTVWPVVKYGALTIGGLFAAIFIFSLIVEPKETVRDLKKDLTEGMEGLFEGKSSNSLARRKEALKPAWEKRLERKLQHLHPFERKKIIEESKVHEAYLFEKLATETNPYRFQQLMSEYSREFGEEAIYLLERQELKEERKLTESQRLEEERRKRELKQRKKEEERMRKARLAWA